MKLRPFELALVIIFGGLAFLSLVLLSSFSSRDSDEVSATGISSRVSIWGTFPESAVEEVLNDLSLENEVYELLSYRYFTPEAFDNELVNALADGNGPDLILVSHEKLVSMRKRIQPVSYDSFPLPDIRNRYVEGAEIFALDDGLYGYPIAVDPLMMYWNRDIMTSAGFLEPPRTWESLVNSMLPQLVQKTNSRTISRSAVAMGEYNNVRNAFGVISLLLLQSGSAGVRIDDNGFYQVELRNSKSGSGDPFQTTVDFYTRFNKPNNSLYSWNRSFGEDRQEFVSEDLTLYFGFGSEGRQIERMNPNLNFGIAEVPQGADDTVRVTYGKTYAISLLNSSTNKGSAASAMSALASSQVAQVLADKAGMAPTFRSLVARGSNDIYGREVYKSAAVALGWLNPDKSASDEVFATMVSDVSDNRATVSGAVSDASDRLVLIYR